MRRDIKHGASLLANCYVWEQTIEEWRASCPSYYRWILCLHECLDKPLTAKQVKQAYAMWMADMSFVQAAKELSK